MTKIVKIRSKWAVWARKRGLGWLMSLWRNKKWTLLGLWSVWVTRSGSSVAILRLSWTRLTNLRTNSTKNSGLRGQRSVILMAYWKRTAIWSRRWPRKEASFLRHLVMAFEQEREHRGLMGFQLLLIRRCPRCQVKAGCLHVCQARPKCRRNCQPAGFRQRTSYD